MSSRLYNSLVDLLTHIRVDPARSGKCFGEFLRKIVSKEFPKGELSSPVDVRLWQANYEVLRALAANVDQRAFPRRWSSSATGFTGDQCSRAILASLHKTPSGEDAEASLMRDLKKNLDVKLE